MAATVTVKERTKFAGLFAVIADITLDSSYPTGGEALTANQFGLNKFSFVLPSPAAGYLFEFDHASKKLKAFAPVKTQAAHTHVFTGTAMSVTPTLIDGAEPATKLLQNDAGILKATDATAVPLGTPVGTNADGGAIAAAAASEVANATDLHAVTVRVLAIGY